MNTLSLRLLTATFLLFVVYLTLFVLSSSWALGLGLLLVALCAFEWAGIVGIGSSLYGRFAYTLLLVLVTVLGLFVTFHQFFIGFATFFFIVVAPYFLLTYRGHTWEQGLDNLIGNVPVNIVLGVLGIFLFVSFFNSLRYLYLLGPKLLLASMLIVWTADSSAYFIGKWCGRRKLLVHVSPNKTVEGALGALMVATIFVGALHSWLIPAVISFPVWILMIVVATVLSIIGDLFESYIKRCRGVKDSGAFLPGHGGILDRVDGLLAALPFLSLLLTFYS